MQFIDYMEFLDKLIRCRLCGSDDSRRDYKNDYIWIADKNRDGNWTHEYICYDCRYLNNNYCYRCGRSDNLFWSYDMNGFWDGRRICYFCIARVRK